MMNQLGNQKKQRSFAQMLWNAKGALALSLFALVLPACGNNEQATAPGAETEQQDNVTAEQVADETEALIGQTVTVRGDVEEVAENSFTIADDDFLDGETILGVNATGEPFVVPEGDTAAQITGEVRQFTVADFEREYGLDLQPELYAEYENKPAIVAQSLAVAPEPDEIAEDPTEYYGQTVGIKGEVEEVYASGAFRLDDGDLLVLVPGQQAAITENETVAATGEVRQFVVADLERDYEFTWDEGIQQQLEAEYRDRPVVIARAVYPGAVPEGAP